MDDQSRMYDEFQTCLAWLEEGYSVEECLKKLPRVEPEMASLLLMAQQMGQIRFPARVGANRIVFEKLREALRPKSRYKWMLPSIIPSILRPALASSVAVVILLLGVWGTSSAAAESVPGEVLYPVKRTQEQFLLILIPSPEYKARLHARLVARRGREMVAVAAAKQALRDRQSTEELRVVLEKTTSMIEAHVQDVLMLVGGNSKLQPLTITNPKPSIPTGTLRFRKEWPAVTGVNVVRLEVHRLLVRQLEVQEWELQRLLATTPTYKHPFFEQAFYRSRMQIYQALIKIEMLMVE
jgi:hypothetical protein